MSEEDHIAVRSALVRNLPIMVALTLAISSAVWAGSLDIAPGGYGVSFGNSKRINGLRINSRDVGVEQVTGVNLTLWKAGDNPAARVNGIAAGLIGPEAQEINGLALGLLGVGAHGNVRGIALGGLGVGAGDDITGISLGFRGRHPEIRTQRFTGLSIGGFNCAEELHGLQLGILNYAGNNPRWARWLPVVNVHL